MQIPTSILNRWKNHFCLLLNILVCGVVEARQTVIHTAEPLVVEPSVFEVKIVIMKLKRCKLRCIHHILAEVIPTGGKAVCYEINKLIKSNENCLNSRKTLLFYPYL
jgi:hypothetical protein